MGLCYDDHHRKHLDPFLVQRAVEDMLGCNSLVFNNEALVARAKQLRLTDTKEDKKDGQKQDKKEDKKEEKKEDQKEEKEEGKKGSKTKKKRKQTSSDSDSDSESTDETEGTPPKKKKKA